MKHSKILGAIALLAALLPLSPFVWGQESAGPLDQAQSELLSSIDSLLTLETEWQNLSETISALQQQIQSLQTISGQDKVTLEKQSDKIRSLETALTGAMQQSEKLTALLQEQRQKLATLKQNYVGLLNLSRELQRSLQTSRDWNLGLGIASGVLALGLVADLVFRR